MDIEDAASEPAPEEKTTADDPDVITGHADMFFRRNGRVLVCLATLLIFLVLPLLLAIYQYSQASNLIATPSYFAEQLAKQLLLTAGTFWFFFLGASFGSFLNVVAWRLPRQRTLLGASYCPGCNTKLKMRDNFPLFGWLWLKGKCRTCGMEIAGRYFLVELLAALAIGTLAIIELIGAGANVHSPPHEVTFSFEQFVMSPQPRLIGYFLLHSSLILILITAALIKLQQQTIPKSIYLFSFGLILVTSISWPHALPFTELHQEITSAQTALPSLRASAWGLVAGFIGGLIFIRLLLARPIQQHWDLALLLMLVGAFLGWQAALVAIALTTVMTLLGRLVYRKFAPTDILWLAVSITIYTLALWIEEWQNRPLDGGS